MCSAVSEVPNELSMYIHIPFCLSKCPYCDFNTYQGIDQIIRPMIESEVSEIRLWGKTLGSPVVSTIFFGGGTPSYIPVDGLAAIIASARDTFQISPESEITLEANPGDLKLEKLAFMLEFGANRLSIGVQSLEDSLLVLLGRRHTALDAEASYRMALTAGFRDVNIDLMYGIPTQTMKQWHSTLERALELRPHHLSLYCLTLEKKTPMELSVLSGDIPEPDPDLAADMYLCAEEELAKAGYHHYEISNWCLPGHLCRHNLTYWLNKPYLGIGPGAHSSIDGYRFHNINSPRQYLRLVHEWAIRGASNTYKMDEDILNRCDPVEEIERIDKRTAMSETMFLGLRLLDGLDADRFHEHHGSEMFDVYGLQIRDSIKNGLLERESNMLRLTKRGRLLANQVFISFLD
jgi:oxygen-independent coproporphyrinogen-3 oxidase